MKFHYRTIDTSTLRGLKTAERLHRNGWRTIRVGMFLVWFEKPAPAREKRQTK